MCPSAGPVVSHSGGVADSGQRPRGFHRLVRRSSWRCRIWTAAGGSGSALRTWAYTGVAMRPDGQRIRTAASTIMWTAVGCGVLAVLTLWMPWSSRYL